MDIDVGSKIKALRSELKMSIAVLSDNTGVSKSMISQIENRKVVPTITVMWKIAKALNVNISYFFDEEDEVEANPVVRKDERKKITVGNSSSVYELLTPDTNRKLQYLLITLDEHKNDYVTHSGEECGYVIQGIMKVHLDGKIYTLYEGDSISFKSDTPHYYENGGEGKCVSIWAMTPPSW